MDIHGYPCPCIHLYPPAKDLISNPVDIHGYPIQSISNPIQQHLWRRVYDWRAHAVQGDLSVGSAKLL